MNYNEAAIQCFRSRSETTVDQYGRKSHFILIDRDDEYISEDNPIGIFVEEAWWVYVDAKHLVLYRSVSPKFGEFKEVRVMNDQDTVIAYANSDDLSFAIPLTALIS